ncbi:probable ubiquitin-conjugating enzyme E2 23 [Zingiber officinale]|uniref:probable ubiquitin-conjugating enzyme E2 23 n=1 Tax=Zingiber officinale TaxID=94328 RepID=UPI001C4B580F|nr:probable ubiquitin-conjugating enzyme E2 23 [Zingiber officinale]
MYEVWGSTSILRTYYNIVDIDFACISNTPNIVKAIDDNEIQVEITWIDGSETTEITSDVTVVDRRFKHGKVVASAVSTQQLGLVMNANISVDLLSMDGKVIRNVCSKDLKPIKEVNVHDFVLLGSAFGKVKKTVDIVTILSDDGSICEAIDVNPLELRPLLKYTRNCPYYPGQRVRSVLNTVFKSTRWISGSRKANRLEGTIIKVHPASVNIDWIYPLDLNDTELPPVAWHNPKDLTMLSFFTYTQWKLIAFCQLPSCQQPPSVVSKGTSTSKETNDTKSTEGSQESWPDYDKMLQNILSKREMKALKKSLEKEESFEKCFFILNTYTTVDVIWQNGTKEYEVQSTSLILSSQNDDQFFLGNFVTKKTLSEEGDSIECNRVGVVVSVNFEDRIVCVRWSDKLKQLDREELVSAYDLDIEYKYCYGDFAVRVSSTPIDDVTILSNFGNIVDFRGGDVVVAWADGVISKVEPQEIVVIILNDDETGADTSDSNGQETNSVNNGEDTTTSLEVSAGESQEDNISEYKFEHYDITENATSREVTGDTQEDNIREYEFKHFDIIENATGHHYYGGDKTDNSGREWASRVQREWKILQKNLPDDIYVRAFEERMDLIRAAIIGADGTPYQNGIFFFDLYLPPDYPKVPPVIE